MVPQVWHQDKSGTWFFVAAGFTEYYRLSLVHLGIPNWQYAFSNVGLPPSTQQWMRLLCPERLALDLKAGPSHVGTVEQKQGGQSKLRMNKSKVLKMDFEKIEMQIRLRMKASAGEKSGGGKSKMSGEAKSKGPLLRPSTALATSPSRTRFDKGVKQPARYSKYN